MKAVVKINYEDIVKNMDCPILVLAGPGAGKTYLLSDRVLRLLFRKIEKDKITVATFGKDASLNMKKELLDPFGQWKLSSKDLPKITTLHSLGLEIIKNSPKTVGLRKTGLIVQHNNSIRDLIYRDAAYILGYSKDDANKATMCKMKGNCEPNTATIECNICDKYWDIMAKCDRIDFDDLILFACRILESEPDILQEYQGKAQHLLVDEYQDINSAQHKLIELLSRSSRNGLFAVGDDAQSIYRFRGASPRFILDFQKYYQDAITPPLLHSRRCHKNILRNAEKVLLSYYNNWTGPFDLEFHQEIDDKPYVWQMPSEIAEANMVAKLVKEYSSMGMSVLLLAPKKELFTEITKVLKEKDVPHVCPINLLPIHTERRLTSLSSITKWVQMPQNNFVTRLTIEAILNGGESKVPGAQSARNLRPDTIERRDKVEMEVAMFWEAVNRNKDMYKVMSETVGLCEELKKVRVVMSGLLEKYELGILEKKEKKTRTEPAEFLRLSSLATGSWMKPEHFVNDLDAIVNLLREKDITTDATVKLMTMRKAKGLQADVVIMIGLEDDIIPNPKSDIEEEARIFYVSMTRAKKKLYMLHAYKRPRNISYGPDLVKKKRSRFLDAVDIDSEYKK